MATGIYWRQNPNVEIKAPEGITGQVSTLGQQQTAVPESFSVITATSTPSPTRQPQPAETEVTVESPNFVGRISRTITESREEREARQREEEEASVAELERKVHDGINAERVSRRGIQPLKWDDRLKAIARGHSEDMTERGYFSHDSPEGLGPTERAAKAGYSCRKYAHIGLAENITIELMSKNVDKLAAKAVQGWMDSPGHRTNLLGRQYDRTGIGASFGKWRGYKAVYITQVFC